MEAKQDCSVAKDEVSLTLDQTFEAISGLKPVPDSAYVPSRKSSSKITDISRQGDEEVEGAVSLGSRPSLGKKLESPGRKTNRRRKSMSAQLLVDVEELVSNVGESFSEVGSMLSRASSNGLGFSISLGGVAMPLDDISDTRRFKNSIHEFGELELATAYEEDLESGNWQKIKLEPTLPIFLKFQDVKYKVSLKGGPETEKYIVNGVTGSVHPGEVLALMGPSGGGKTTLLNLLSGRVRNSNANGSITYNDQPYSHLLKRRIGFVMQDDVVFPHLTVKETLTYAALLRLPKTLTKQQKEERAMNIISELGLERCQDTIIGGAFMRGISGGERKRVCIGNEILLNPSLLFLDEPTSGLDSTMALRIIDILHHIAKTGKTVLTTIHQPSSRLFNKFDKLILLGKGSSLYFGKASEAMLYFSSIGCSPLVAMNPAEFLIDLANGNIIDKSIPSELEDRVAIDFQEFKTQQTWPSSSDVHEYLVGAYENKVAHIEKNMLLKPVVIEDKWDGLGVSDLKEWGASWWEQFSVLFWRGLKERRHDYLSFIRITQVISTAIIVGLLWWNSDDSSDIKVQDQAGLLFFISVFWGFFPVFTAIFTFPQERAMLVKERSVGMYRLSAYFMARNMSDLPLDLVLPVVFLLIVYFMVGLKSSCSAFFLSMLAVFLSIVSAQGLGLAIGAAFMDVKKATTLASVIVMTFMLAGGFFIQSVPTFVSCVRYISFNYHTYRLLVKIQYSCSGPDSDSGSCKSPYLKGLRLGGGGEEAGALVAMIFVYRVLTYLFLRNMKIRTAT